MGEPACLMRSFSHPSDSSRESKEGGPIRALTESISLGRFMSESLAWEKWSVFNHNRYLEEVEQFSKPGSVAEKKAFFEAHYKKRAAMKAAALLEQANTSTANASIAENATTHIDPPPDHVISDVAIDQQQEDDVDVERAHVASPDVVLPPHASDSLPHSEVERNRETVIEQSVMLENPIQVQNMSKELKNAQSSTDIVITPKERVSSTEVDNFSQKLDKMEDFVEPVTTPEERIPAIHVDNNIPRNLEDAEDLVDIVSKPEERMPDKLKFQIVKKEKAALPSNKIPVTSPSWKPPTQRKASKIPKSPAKMMASSALLDNELNSTPKSKNIVGDSIDKKRTILKPVHISMNFASHEGATCKESLEMPKSSAIAARNQMRASVSGASKPLPSTIHKSDDRRVKSIMSQSVSSDRLLQAIPGNSGSPTAAGSKVRSSTIFSPFSFKSEERAAKRKEFFQKLQEKNNAKQAEKMHAQVRSKETRKSQRIFTFRAKASEDLQPESQPPSNLIKKVPLIRPQSSKLGRKPHPAIVKESNCRPPRRPPVNPESSKHVTSQNNTSTRHSVTSLPKNKAHENASPNILH